jgi:hypothetical protein
MEQITKIKWLRVVRDVVIIRIFLFVEFFFALRETSKSLVGWVELGFLGLMLCGFLVAKNGWKHFVIVVLGVWLIFGLPEILSPPFSVHVLVGSIVIVFVPLVLGGTLSIAFVKSPKQKEEKDK